MPTETDLEIYPDYTVPDPANLAALPERAPSAFWERLEHVVFAVVLGAVAGSTISAQIPGLLSKSFLGLKAFETQSGMVWAVNLTILAGGVLGAVAGLFIWERLSGGIWARWRTPQEDTGETNQRRAA